MNRPTIAIVLLATLVAAVLILLNWTSDHPSPGPAPPHVAEPVEHPAPGDTILALEEVESDRVEVEPGGSAPPTIRLRAVSELAVRVVDASRQPRGGIPVHFDFRRGSRYSGGPLRVVSQESDGIARFASLPRARREGEAPATEAFLAAGIVQSEPDWQPISLDPWPSEPVELVLPATGEVLVVVTGLPPGTRGWCELGVLEPGRPVGRMIRGGSASVSVEEGEALFPLVGLGLELGATVHLEGTGSSHTGRLTGPVRSGGRCTLRIDLASRPVLVGRLLGDDGEPVGKGEWHITILSEELNHGTSLETDADGGFRFVLSERMQRGKLKSLQIEPRRDPRNEEPSEPREAVADLPPSLGPGIHQLGDLSMKEPHVLAAGRVVDHAGTPVAGARVFLMQLAFRSPQDGQEHWRIVRTIENVVRTGDDGKFRCHGKLRFDQSELRVHGELEGHFQLDPLPCTPGSEGLVVVLQQSGALAYELLAPEGMDRRQWPSMKLVAAGGGGDPLQQRPNTREPKEELWDSIPPGTYTLSLHHDCALGPLLEVAGIVIAPNQTTRDSRLLPLDLGQAMRLVRITVLDSAGAPFEPDLMFIYLHENRAGGESVQRQPDGSFLIPTGNSESVDLIIRSDGYRSVHIEGLDGDREVVMTDRIAVTLRLGESPPRLSDDHFVGLELRGSKTRGFTGRYLAADVEGDPCATKELK